MRRWNTNLLGDYRMKCNLQQLPDGRWWCPACDPEKKRLLPRFAHRNCRAPAEHPRAPVTFRQQIETRIRRLVGPGTRTMDAIQATLDKCFAPCKYLEKTGCPMWGNDKPCKRGERWIESIMYNDCRLFEEKK